MSANSFSLDGARFYSHILPAFRAHPLDEMEVCGAGWAMIGDCAGLVDPITGEGLYYALRSAELCAEALLVEEPTQYRSGVEQEILPEIKRRASRNASTAARFSERAFLKRWQPLRSRMRVFAP